MVFTHCLYLMLVRGIVLTILLYKMTHCNSRLTALAWAMRLRSVP